MSQAGSARNATYIILLVLRLSCRYAGSVILERRTASSYGSQNFLFMRLHLLGSSLEEFEVGTTRSTGSASCSGISRSVLEKNDNNTSPS